MSGYDHKKIEKKWQEFWAQNKIYTTPDEAPGKENFFLLVEFPYPSGNLHVGHWYAFAIPDILARAMRMQGKNVMYPIGFDAFGLPAENAAIKNHLNPREWTEKNMAYMKGQIASMGTSFDWSREVSTIDPKYYKWTQWLFLQLYKKGLVYQRETAVNWCPTDKTVLANEQVVDGKCERCGSEVVQRQMLQWNIKITDYADRLIDDLSALDWPEQIKESQRNWIGRSEGAEIDFALDIDTKIKRFVILHAKGATPGTDFYPWLTEKLEARGYEVQVPHLPNPEEPDDEEQTDYVMAHCTFDEHTAVIGHSFGCIVAFRLLERGVKLGRVTLVGAGYSGDFVDGKARPTVTAALKKGFDFDAIKKNCGGFIVLHDMNDPVIPSSDADVIAEKTGGLLMRVKASAGHFNSAKEEDVLMAAMPTIRVFTTRPDTLFGATYLVLAPEHPWLTEQLNKYGHPMSIFGNDAEVRAYIERTKMMSEMERQTSKEKTGVKLEGVAAINPATGGKIPIFVADYVLGHYGTGAIMAVPAHDERDYEFAKKFDLPVKEVIEPIFTRTSGVDGLKPDLPFVRKEAVDCIIRDPKTDKYLMLQWKNLPWITLVTGGVEDEDLVTAAKREIYEETGYKNVRLVKELGGVHAQFYHVNKKANTWAHGHGFYFELIDDERDPVSEEEAAIHDVLWVTKEEIEKQLSVPDMREIWQRHISGGRAYGGDGVLVNSGEFSGMTVADAKKALTEKYGRAKKTYRLRDWIVSRQRYWGVPIPIVHCAKCGSVPVPDEQLPVELPPVVDYLPEGSGKSPLAKVSSFVKTTCPTCGSDAERETDTLDTFVDSSWYFNRYVDPQNTAEFASKEKQEKWMPVSLYSGGAEHTTMHLLYSRFWHKALFDLGLVKDSEPYMRRMNRSIILGPDGQKMSKSRGNVIDPDDAVERLGADTVRLYLAFIGPYNEVASYPWNPDGVVGVRRFLERVWALSGKIEDAPVGGALETSLHASIKKVTDDIAAMKFNTAISQMMILVNACATHDSVPRDLYETLLKLLAPFAPHMTEELWHEMGHSESIHRQPWPVYDESKTVSDTVMIAIQIDGKTRADVSVPRDADKAATEAAARGVVAERLAGKRVARVVVVPKRLVNFVLVK